jgi:hypothetical protein
MVFFTFDPGRRQMVLAKVFVFEAVIGRGLFALALTYTAYRALPFLRRVPIIYILTTIIRIITIPFINGLPNALAVRTIRLPPPPTGSILVLLDMRTVGRPHVCIYNVTVNILVSDKLITLPVLHRSFRTYAMTIAISLTLIIQVYDRVVLVTVFPMVVMFALGHLLLLFCSRVLFASICLEGSIQLIADFSLIDQLLNA